MQGRPTMRPTSLLGGRPTMGLKTLVREDLKLRGINKWDRKAPVATPNAKRTARLQMRVADFEKTVANSKNPNAFTRPGSLKG